VIAKLLEAFFRHKLLILLPPILIPLIVGPIAYLMTPPYYQTTAAIWVDRPTYISYQDDWSRYVTPAQHQRDRLNELLRTRSFVTSIARRTALAPLLGSRAGEERIYEMFRNFTILPTGPHLLILAFRAETPQNSLQVTTALIETFREKTTEDRMNQAQIAIAFYESSLQTAQEKYTEVSGTLRRYVAANPRLTAMDTTRSEAGAGLASVLPPIVTEPQLADLMQQEEVARGDVERARTSLQQARFNSSAALEGQDLGFQLVDRPQVSSTAARERRKVLVYPAAALLVGLGLSAALMVLLVAGDRTARSESDLAARARVVGVVPRLRLKRRIRRAGPDVTRRAVGYVAGTALPAPTGAK
jgi:capsular polysaccharide biosynthesis protein